MEQIANFINSIIWSDALVFLCVAIGLYFTFAMKFMQFRYIREMVRLLFNGKPSKHGVSSFQAFTIAISGRVGTGNIIGVATAIAMGGPGAVFWMWTIALLGASSAYMEATLGQIYKTVKDGQFRGGPAYYIEKGLGVKWYAILFCIATILSTALFLPGVQSNSISSSMNNAFDVPVEITGAAVTLLLGLIVFGGVKRIGKVAEIVVPFMAGAYVLMAVIIIILNIKEVPSVMGLIFRSAFDLEPLFGGIFGMAVSWGVKRGLYSNEAGQGTAPHAASAAEVSHPAKQGLVQAFSVYIDTIFVCTATALMILFTNQYQVNNPEGGFIIDHNPGVDATGFTQAAVSTHFPTIGHGFVAIALLFFAFTTIMAYYYIAETNLSYLQPKKTNKWWLWLLRIGLLGATFYGSVKSAQLAWTFGDIGVGLMAWINLIAIFLLRKPALKAFKDYIKQRKQGKDPVFNAKELGIKNTEVWGDKT